MIRALAKALLLVFFATTAAAQTSREGEVLSRALNEMRSGDWFTALRTAEGAGPVARDIVEWHRLRAGQGDFDSVLRFLERRPDWPGLPYLKEKSEGALPLAARADEVLVFFRGHPPETGTGAIALISAYRGRGQVADAEAEAVRAWLTLTFSEADEAQLLDWYGGMLAAHHEARLDMLLWRAAKLDVERMLPRVGDGWRRLAQARLALRFDENGVDALVNAVPASLADDAGLAFERMQWRARKGRNEAAIELMLERGADRLGQPERWAGWRRSLARAEMRAGRPGNAYRLASEHGLTSGESFADLEWLAGYVALTYRDDPARALAHFLRFRGAVESPISLGRAGYWEGRAHEALGDPEAARLSYAFGGEYQTSFYGLLAAEKAGMAMDPELYAPAPDLDWRGAAFVGGSVFEAARLLRAAGETALAVRFLTHLTESLDAADVARLGVYVLELDEPYLATMIGKRAVDYGATIPFVYYPVTNLGVSPLPVPEELALSIARRESEFNPRALSGVGARGLMQVMPATARHVAGELGIDFDNGRLLSDPVYNARIGTAYLDELMALFDGNPVMVAAGYNAGPGRPMRWMDERGDPRRGRVDMIDWIEHIPFDETRNYVMRVTESLPIYRARLTGRPQPMDLSRELVAAPGHARSAVVGEQVRPRARPGWLTD